MRMLLAQNLKDHARQLGFHWLGLTPAMPSPTLAHYERWIAAGMQGSMGFLAREDRLARRRDLRVILPDVQTLLLVGFDYRTLTIPETLLHDPTRGRIANYAWGLDYHELLQARLETFAAWLCQQYPALQQRVYVDTGAILERSHAQQAGLGFIGKNTMLIHPRRGSYFFIGEILLTLPADEYDRPHRETLCGTCTRCLAACPTQAFPQPYVLDARRCISYHTIENKGWIDRELRPLFGNWVFGCDVCQEVCPFQRFAPLSAESAFFPVDLDRALPPLARLLTLTDAEFMRWFRGSPVARIKRERLVRNACIAAGNSAHLAFVPLLRALLADASPLLRGHAAWALWRLIGMEAYRDLQALQARETDENVLAEVGALLK